MKILYQVFNQLHSSHIAALLLTPLDAAHREQRGVARLLRRHAFGDVFFNLPIDVIAELLVQFLLDLRAAKERSKPQWQGVEPVFDTHLSSLLIRGVRQPSDLRARLCAPANSPPAGPPSGATRKPARWL